MEQKLAIVFPGQGSQSIGMLSELIASRPIVAGTFEEASGILGYDMAELVSQGPAEQLNQTTYTQPALLTAGIAMWRLYCEQGGKRPDYFAGHSLGEYSALVAAESIEFADALKIVTERGRLMQEACPEGLGAMAAIIGLEEKEVFELCNKISPEEDEVLSPANCNAIGQTVVAGHRSAVERLLPAAKEAGAKIAKILPVSVPSHCALMRDAADKLYKILEATDMKNPVVQVIHNTCVAPANDVSQIRHTLMRQLYCPVHWVETIQFFAQKGVNTLYELGPGKVLVGLNKRIEKSMTAICVEDEASLAQCLKP